MIEGDTNLLDDNLISWKLLSFSPTNLVIKLEFLKPLEVS